MESLLNPYHCYKIQAVKYEWKLKRHSKHGGRITYIPATLVRVLTPLVSPNEKNFESCACLVFPWLIHPVYFWWLFGSFCICLFSSIRCSCHLPAIFGSFWGSFVPVCLHHQFSSSRHSPFNFGGFLSRDTPNQ